jgi:8-oxo-dGTP pyrophosphatase MutT (NUDIX family)
MADGSGGEPVMSGASGARAGREVAGPLAPDEFDRIFRRVPRLTVELVIAVPERGVLLQLRQSGPCQGLWSLPGGTVRFGEPVVAAVERVAAGELGVGVEVGRLLGYIEYPSHYTNGLDSPVGLAFATRILDAGHEPPHCRWFSVLPPQMHPEQRSFLEPESS